MPVFFANPTGFFALLGVPVLLAIYFFQRQSREYLAPTMFLLKSQFEHRKGGRQFKRFQPSWVLFLQLLSVILISLLLSQPRIKKAELTQKVALVIDSSASMSAFKKEILDEVTSIFQELDEEESAFSIQVFQSLPESVALYSGRSPVESRDAINSWTPSSGTIDPATSLNLARSRVGQNGLLLYFTDHVPEGVLPAGAKLITVGRPLDNVGFCGVSVKQAKGQYLAHALVKNYGRDTEERVYQLQSPSGDVLLEKELSLMPQQVKTITYPLSSEQSAVCFALAPDEFTLDDIAPIILPVSKALTMEASQQSIGINELVEKLAGMLGASKPEKGIPDIIIRSQPVGKLRLPETNSITFVEGEKGRVSQVHTASILPTATFLTRDLVWDTLIVPETPVFPSSARDQVILWAGDVPLISLRVTNQGEDSSQHLLCHFSIEGSNIDTQANLAILFFRFAEHIREQKVAYFSEIAEVNQSLSTLSLPFELKEEIPLILESKLHYAPTYQRTISKSSDLRMLHLPSMPNIIALRQGDQRVATYATHFADTREADFSKAQRQERLSLVSESQRLQSSIPLPYHYLILLFLILLVLGIWWLQADKPQKIAVVDTSVIS